MKPLENQLSHLEKSGLIAIAKLLPELEYLFRHALVQDAAYESLLRKDRRVLHRAVGEALEAAYADRLDELAPTLADHYREADNRAKAVDYTCRAGQRALSQYANQEAEMHFRAGLELTTDPAERARLMAGLGEALVGQSRMLEAIQVWRDGITLYRETADQDQVALMFARSARASWWAGDSRGALELCEQGLMAVPADLETNGIAALLHEAARSYYFDGQLEAARTHGERALKMAERLDNMMVKADALNTLGLLKSNEDGIHALEQAIEVAEKANYLTAAGRAHHNLATLLYGLRFDLLGALPHLLRSAEIARQRAVVADQIYSLGIALFVCVIIGDMPQAWRIHDQLLALSGTLEAGSIAALTIDEYYGDLMRYLGRFEEAREAFNRCRTASLSARDEYTLREIDNILLPIAMEEDKLDEAEMYAAELLGLSRVVMLEVTWSNMQIIWLRVRQGRIDEARKLLDETRTDVSEAPNPVLEAFLNAAEMRVAAAEGRWADAERAYERVAAAYRTNHAPSLQANIMLEWSQALINQDRPRAITVLREARAIYEAMGAPVYVQRVDARIAALTQESSA